MNDSTEIKCPNCGALVDVQDIISHKLEDQIKQKYNDKLAKEKKKFEKEQDALSREKSEFEKHKKQENELIQKKIEQQLKDQKKQLVDSIRLELKEEQSEQITIYEKELKDKSDKLKDLNRTKAEIEKLKREKEELKGNIEAEAQIKITEQVRLEKEKIRKFEKDRNELRFKELQKKYEDQKKLTEEMKRKQEQGSTQMQGEVQELAIEQWLANSFPLDSIDEIKKGARGGDCIQVVNTRLRQNCGSIYYESKRTKSFQLSWIEKFKNDIRDKGANIGVLVTDAMPLDMTRFGMKDGIWICSYEEFKGLCFVLRESIIQISNAISTQENKGDKMTMLHNFLTSNEFKLQIEAIVEGFTQMKTDLDSEKRSIMGHWKKREKQIQKVLLNTNYMYNSIRGIVGNAIQPVQALELPESSE